MTLRGITKRQGYLWTGLFGIVLSAGYFVAAADLPLGTMDEPGARLFPILVDALLLIASLACVREALMSPDMKGKLDFPVGADAKRLGGLVLLLLAYFCAMPWAGFLLSSLGFATLLVRLLSASGWFRCIVYGVLITALTWLFFIYFLKVPMPSGVIFF